MERVFQRGFQFSKTNRITKLFAEGAEWQIYSTSTGGFALAVDKSLYEYWDQTIQISETSIFLKGEGDIFYFAGREGYLISSLEFGPYPDEYVQIEAFANAFGMFQKKHPDVDLTRGLYLEEYSMLLPVKNDQEKDDLPVVFGKWISGGVSISIESIDRVTALMSWLPQEAIARSASIAGFKVRPKVKAEEIGNTDNNSSKNAQREFKLTGRPELERFLNENIIDIVSHQEQYARMGIDFPGATILYGPPGSGKTFAIEKLAEFLGWPRFDVDSSTIASPYIHETGKKVAEVFQSAIDAAPSILVIDEMEAFLTNRGMDGQGGHHVEEVAEFLRRIPEASAKGVLIFAMTNLIDSIDPAILRRGRFDHIIEVGMASKEEVEDLLKLKFKELPINANVDVSDLAAKLAGHPLSDVSFIVREAGRLAVKRKLDEIDVKCFEEAMSAMPAKKEETTIGFHS